MNPDETHRPPFPSERPLVALGLSRGPGSETTHSAPRNDELHGTRWLVVPSQLSCEPLTHPTDPSHHPPRL